jgi:tetratricopeptide (TPR) repeat protein
VSAPKTPVREATPPEPESATMRPGDDRFVDRSGGRYADRFVAHLATAGELVAASRFREAEVEVLRALSGLPADLRALNLLALVRVKLGRLEEARATYRDISAAAPNDAAARRHLGLLSLKLERVEEAIPDLEMAARLAPGDQQAWSYLGYAYAKKGETVAAAAAFRRAGQDALADELEHAATTRRPSSGPKLAALPVGGAGTPVPSSLAARGGTPAPAALVLPPPSESRPPSRVSPSAALAPAPVTSTGSAVVAPAPSTPRSVASNDPTAVAPAPLDVAAPVELTAVPLLGFVLARLGLGEAPRAPRGEALRLGVEDEAYVRAGAALASVGVRFEPAFRRMQGRRSAEPLAGTGAPFFRLVGPGEVWVAGAPGAWQAVSLEDDILYVREDRVLAFDGGVSWEAGAVPGDGLRMLQFRGRGCVVLRLDAPPVAIKVTEDRPALVTSASLLGWVGRLVTHRQRMAAVSPFELACQGEGVVLFDPGRAIA